MSQKAWEEILQQPFGFDEDGGLRFDGPREAPARRLARPFACPLPQQAFLTIAGPDAARFLQGQLSCDVSAVTLQQSTPGCHCTPKGRVIASFQLARSGEDAFLLSMPASMMDITQRALSRYVVFSKADIADTSGSWLAAGLSGAAAAGIIRQFCGKVPEAPHQQVNMPGGLCIRIAGEQPRFWVWLRVEQAAAFWQAASAGLNTADSEVWALQDIRAGLATVLPETSELFVPQMLDYDRTGAVSFRKGCYTGQEVVARAHYRGAVKRHLRRVAGSGEGCPAPGAVIYGEGQAIGHIVASVQAAPDLIEGLAVVQVDSPARLALSAGGSPTLDSFSIARQ